jgi:hypothetical protein
VCCADGETVQALTRTMPTASQRVAHRRRQRCVSARRMRKGGMGEDPYLQRAHHIFLQEEEEAMLPYSPQQTLLGSRTSTLYTALARMAA